MGGHALPKNLDVVRMSYEQLQAIKKVLDEKLSHAIKIDFTRDLPGKTSFGDVDVLFYVDEELKKRYLADKLLSSNKQTEASEKPSKQQKAPQYAVDLINDIFNPKSLVKNGEVFSFSFPALDTELEQYNQIDMIKCNNHEHYLFMKFYLSYGDVGGILGKITHHHGIKIGQDGLYIDTLYNTLAKYWRDRDRTVTVTFASDDLASVTEDVILPECENDVTESRTDTEGSILLTLDPREACDYLGVSYDQWLCGFSSDIEIYEWIIQSRFFSREQFTQMNKDNRRKANHRPFYKAFVEYIGVDVSTIEDSYGEQPIDKDTLVRDGDGRTDNIIRSDHQYEAIRHFNKQAEMDILIEKYKEKVVRKAARAERLRLLAL